MCLKSWYLKFLKSDASKRMSIEKAFTRKAQKKFVLNSVENECAMNHKLKNGKGQQTSEFEKTCKKGKGFNWRIHDKSCEERRLGIEKKKLGIKKRENFSPVLTAGECEPDAPVLDVKVEQARLLSLVLSPLDHDVALDMTDPEFADRVCYN